MSAPTVLGVACDVYVSPADCISQRERVVCDACADAHPDAADPTPVDRADVTTPRQGTRSGDDVDERWPA